ncbi:MAG: SNF2-related protein [Ilumatobacteraceae bacterium]
MTRDRSPFVAQGTWRSRRLHVWGWNGESTASTAWLYGGIRGDRSGGPGWHDSPMSYGELGRLELELPSGGRRLVSAVVLDAFGAAVWLSDLPDPHLLSPSLAWFDRLTAHAVRLVAAHRVRPSVVQEGPYRRARWVPVLDTTERDAVAHFAACAPAICRNGSTSGTEEILAALVDGFARAVLHHGGWRPDLGRRRAPEVQSVRAVFSALAAEDAAVRDGSDDYESALVRLTAILERHGSRLQGEPVVRGRIRLTLPEDALDPWLVDLELVHDVDPGRWCTLADVRSVAPRAVDVAGSVEHVDVLARLADELLTAVTTAVPTLARLGSTDEGATLELDLDEAEEFLDTAPHELDRLDVELLGPEHLVRTAVRVRGTASAGPVDDRRRRFGAEALVEWTAVVDDTPLGLAELQRVEAAGSTLMRAGHRWVRLDPAGLRRARRFLDEREAQGPSVGPVDLLRWSAGTGDGVSEGVVPVEIVVGDAAGDTPPTGETEHGWISALLSGLADEGLTEALESAEFRGQLRHYQRRGLAWLQFLARVGLGGCLADDMGLGKTATTLAHLVERPGPHLVVCPLSVVHNWEAECRRFTPSRSVVVHHGTERMTDGIGPDADVVITTYGLLPRDVEVLSGIAWSTVVLDEAQVIKNPNTKSARAVRRLRAEQKLALTGTPVENRLSELWAILDAVNPGMLGSQQRFREQFALPIERHRDADAATRLRTLTQPVVLRRVKADRRLLPDLPDKIEQIAFAQLTREQSILYQQVVDRLLDDAEQLEGMQRRGRVLAALTRLKQICNHPAQALKDGSRLAGRSGKLNRFDELVAELLDVGERALVFTQFREMGDLLQRHVAERFESAAPFLHGGSSRTARERMVAEFQSGTGPPLLIVSLKAGGTGLNLTSASQVVHYDRWWNPAVEDQATDRAWRIGQTRTVNVHKLVCQGTVEERIGEVIDEKRSIADAVVGSGEAWLSELSTEQLADLVRLV